MSFTFNFDTVMWIVALICFVAAALNAKVTVNLVAVGLAFVALAFIF